MAAPASAELQASVDGDWRGMLTWMIRPDGWAQDWAYNEGGLMTSYASKLGISLRRDENHSQAITHFLDEDCKR